MLMNKHYGAALNTVRSKQGCKGYKKYRSQVETQRFKSDTLPNKPSEILTECKGVHRLSRQMERIVNVAAEMAFW